MDPESSAVVTCNMFYKALIHLRLCPQCLTGSAGGALGSVPCTTLRRCQPAPFSCGNAVALWKSLVNLEAQSEKSCKRSTFPNCHETAATRSRFHVQTHLSTGIVARWIRCSPRSEARIVRFNLSQRDPPSLEYTASLKTPLQDQQVPTQFILCACLFLT